MINTSRQSTALPTAAVSDSSGDEPWSNPTNVLTDNGSNATWAAVNGADVSDGLRMSGFGFAIPDNAVIDGIAVAVGDIAQSGAYTLELRVGTNTILGQNKGGLTTLLAAYGSATDTWAASWTPADINGSDFYVQIACGDVSGGDATVAIDYVQVTIFWHFDVSVAPAEVALRYDYKVYDPDGKYLGNLPNVISEYETVQDINSTGAQLNIEIAGTPDGIVPGLATGGLTRWIPGDWAYRQRIVVPSANVAANQSGIPLLVDLSALGSLFWHGLHSSAGADIRVTNNDGVSELPFEIVNINTTTKTGELWFKADRINYLYDTGFYIYYGSPTASAYSASAAYGSQSVWTVPAAALVVHLQSNTHDSSSFTRPSITYGTPTYAAGACFGNGRTHDGVDDRTDFGGSAGTLDSDMAGQTTIAISFWIKRASTQAATAIIFAINSSDGSVNKLLIGFDGASATALSIWKPSTGPTAVTGNVTDNNRHLVKVLCAGTTILVYVDGEITYNNSSWDSITLATGDYWTFGAERDAGSALSHYSAAQIDELQITYGLSALSAAVSTTRQKMEYTNQIDPGDFFRYDTRQDGAMHNLEGSLARNGNNVVVYETSYYYPNGKLMFRGQINRTKGRFDPNIDGTIKMICHSDGRDLDSFPARGGPFTYTTDQSQITGNAAFTVTEGTSYTRCGQLWTVGAGVTNLGRLRLAFGGDATVTVSIYDGPNGAFLGSVTKYVNVPWATAVDFEFDFIPVSASADYFAAISVAAGQTIDVWYSSGANPYANGSMYTASYSGGSGGSFAISANNDLFFLTASGTPSTQATYTGKDPTSEMLPALMTDYNVRGGLITLGDHDANGMALTMYFNSNTIYEAIKKILEASLAGFYYYVDLGTNELIMKRLGSIPDHLFVRGRHVGSLELDFSIENVINDELFSGGDTGGGTNLYSEYLSPTSKKLYRQRLARRSDNRVTQQTTADAMGQSDIKEYEDEQQYTTVTIYARTMDITKLKPGDLVAPRAYGNYIDSFKLQIVRVHYKAAQADLVLGTLPIRFNSEYEQVVRGLIAEQTVNNPSTPS